MLHELKRIYDKDETIIIDELRRAAAIAMERQFLFCDNRRDQRSYHHLLDHEDYFRNLFDALGLDLICDRTAGYVGVVPRELSLLVGLDSEHSLFLLALRLNYERYVQECRIGENSQAFTDSEVLLDIYESHTKRKRPGLVRLRAILNTFSRQGLLEKDEDEDKLIRFRIRPSIRDVVTHSYLQALEEFALIGDVDTDEVEGTGRANEDTE
ncbi:DUF4194 domain-containing protein [Pelotalea chapellei]|uniref:DUF4194 domain-containing protein n=1 Tax=Pelotalea chapellei TaxID=44671 RepID=A0ABS5U4S6_9BACT|nr:DUF4194 domain-containing protein [Pelotalea chapellei]MBT1070678.1 DUF4194 domain-containing protein [Pelotalea chapellei]